MKRIATIFVLAASLAFTACTQTATAELPNQIANAVEDDMGNPITMDVLDAHPDAMYNTIMLEGRINGDPAHAIALVTYGKTDDGSLKSGVHAFMAPKDKFKALGGYAVPAVYWLQGSNQPGTDMREDGALPPQEAVNTFSTFFARYVEAYVVPMMQIQMNTLHNMQSWNNAMNACAGDPACTVSPTTDGSGNWEPVVQ